MQTLQPAGGTTDLESGRLSAAKAHSAARLDAVTSQAANLRKTATGWLTQAPAKLNLYLDVLGKRADGFHDLETLICPISWFDTLHVVPRDNSSEIQLRVISAGSAEVDQGCEPLPTDERNLVVRALHMLRQRLGVTTGAAVTLWKRIPSRAGLGGGSSDAAAALRLGGKIWNAKLPQEAWHSLASQIGSDVPVLLEGRAAICRGRGEQLQPVPTPAGIPCVMLQPPVGLGAGQVFSELRGSDLVDSHAGLSSENPMDKLSALRQALARGDLRSAGRWMTNRLQLPASRLTDWIEQSRDAFTKLSIAAHQMSGSGSVYFGLCENWRVARLAAAKLRQLRYGWVGVAALC